MGDGAMAMTIFYIQSVVSGFCLISKITYYLMIDFIKHTITAFFSFLLQTVLLIDCQYSVSVLCMTVTVGPFFFFSCATEGTFML